MSEIRKDESVRAWYEHATKRARKALAFATLVTTVVAVLAFIFAPEKLILHAQVFNGALTIPAAGGIWIAAFMFIWLIPMRELSFRSQESLERTEARVQDAVENKLAPAIDTWKRVGDKVESEIAGGLVEELRAAIKEVRTLTKNLDERTKSLDREVKPTLAEMRDAMVEIRAYVAPQPQPTINLQRTLETLRRGRAPGIPLKNGSEERKQA